MVLVIRAHLSWEDPKLAQNYFVKSGLEKQIWASIYTYPGKLPSQPATSKT